MADDVKPPANSPFSNMVTEASEGRIGLRMDLEQFVHLDRDCQTFIEKINQIQAIMDRISAQEVWGLGEGYHGDGKDLISGKKVVEWFRTKSKNPGDTEENATSNSVWAVMVSHKKAVMDIQETYRKIREQITSQDAEAAARYKQLEETLPQQPPATPPAFHVQGLPPRTSR
ncbi:hypothetical protein [Nocardia wallacei]|uniref:hypothetical protein n=1 Tax=Nocardia wallacei TaxID=480035 RepID=UPI0024589BD1|nr:hypothetical protein [Nocardia wallacei]